VLPPKFNKNQLTPMKGSILLTTTLITLITILERLLATGALTTALSALFRRALTLLGV